MSENENKNSHLNLAYKDSVMFAPLKNRMINRMKQQNRQPLMYINGGTYGCAFRPPLPCSNKEKQQILKIIKKPMIGKYFDDNNELLDEKYEFEKLKEINAESKFTPKMYLNCNVNTTQLNSQDKYEFEKCKFDDKYNHKNEKKRHRQIVFEDGGSDLRKISKQFSFFEYFPYMLVLFEGILTMHKKQYIHNDIKSQNIVFNRNTKRMLFIDFGITNSYQNIYNYQFARFVKIVYSTYPPEFTMFRLLSENRDKENPFISWDFFQNVDQNFTENNMKKHSNNDLMFRLSIDKNDIIRHSTKKFSELISYTYRMNELKYFYEYIKNKYLEIKKKYINYFKDPDDIKRANSEILKIIFSEHANKICVYAMGSTIHSCFLNSLSNTYLERNRNIEFIEKAYPSIFGFIIKLIEPNPIKRIGPEKALEEYKMIYNKLQLQNFKT